MSPDFSQTLWSNPERSRFFLIPDDRQLPPGDFALRTIIGRQMEVDETALAAFEVTRDEAKAKLKEQFGQILATAKGGIMDALKSWRSPQTQQKSGSERKTSTADTKLTVPQSRTEDALDKLFWMPSLAIKD